MGQYRLGFYIKSGVGVYFHCEADQINIFLPFVLITIGLNKSARGIRFFKEVSNE